MSVVSGVGKQIKFGGRNQHKNSKLIVIAKRWFYGYFVFLPIYAVASFPLITPNEWLNVVPLYTCRFYEKYLDICSYFCTRWFDTMVNNMKLWFLSTSCVWCSMHSRLLTLQRKESDHIHKYNELNCCRTPNLLPRITFSLCLLFSPSFLFDSFANFKSFISLSTQLMRSQHI